MISNPVVVYNTSIAQSLTDAQDYLFARGLPQNLVGINFGTSEGYVPTFLNLQDGGLAVQANSVKWRGTTINAFDGESLLGCVQDETWSTLGALPDAILCSTYTPLVVYSGSSPPFMTLPGTLGVNFYGGVYGYSNSLAYVMPHGRLGCPATGGNADFAFTVEMTPRAGGSILTQCYQNAIAAERNFNFSQPHVLSSTGGPYVAGGPPGFDAAYWPALMAAARSRYVNFTYDLCSSTYPCGTSAANDFLNGTVSPPIPIFGLCCPFNANGDTNAPGAHVYSNNYTVLPGGWSAHWYSFQWYWAMDFLFNGGSAAFLTVSEPLENGIHDPKQFLVAMMDQGLSLAECLTKTVAPAADSYMNVFALEYQTVIGDPLYRPYATRARPPGAGYPPGLPL